MLSWLYKKLPLEYRRRQLLKKVTAPALRTYLEKPLPGKKTAVDDIEFLVLDFETTGLDTNEDSILSIGYTVIRKCRVIMAENHHVVVRPQAQLPKQSVVIHKITDTIASDGVPLESAIENLLAAMAGRVVVAHHAQIEQVFLNRACEMLYKSEIPLLMVDTLQLEKRRLEREQAIIKPGQLRLFNIRKACGLPRAPAHNALEDAIATAELLLLMITRYAPAGKVLLGDLL